VKSDQARIVHSTYSVNLRIVQECVVVKTCAPTADLHRLTVNEGCQDVGTIEVAAA
jgi:hypothetical protein